MTLHNLLINKDTIVLFGEIKHETKDQWGALFLRMDTLGNIIDHQTHFDSLGDHFIFDNNFDVVQTRDGGYAMVGEFFSRTNAFILKMAHNGTLGFIKEYPDEYSLSTFHWGLIETASGFISFGRKQQQDDYQMDAFVMKTDIKGNKQWELNYGDFGIDNSFLDMHQISDNEYLLVGGSTFNDGIMPLSQAWLKYNAIKIDSLGNILWEWESEQLGFDQFKTLLLELNKDVDGNWVSHGTTSFIYDESTIVRQCEIMKRDTNFNIIWSTSFGDFPSAFNFFYDITQTPDGGWVAAGQTIHVFDELDPNDETAGVFIGGYLAKVNAQGDSLWSRADTVFASHVYDARGSLGAVVALPSGSTIACGTMNRYNIDPPQSYGWVIKVDKDGCLIPNCNPTTSGVNLASFIEGVEVFPNPTTDFVQVSYDGIFDIEIYNNTGQLLEYKKNLAQQTTMNLMPYPKGAYILKIKSSEGTLSQKIIKQ